MVALKAPCYNPTLCQNVLPAIKRLPVCACQREVRSVRGGKPGQQQRPRGRDRGHRAQGGDGRPGRRHAKGGPRDETAGKSLRFELRLVSSSCRRRHVLLLQGL